MRLRRLLCGLRCGQSVRHALVHRSIFVLNYLWARGTQRLTSACVCSSPRLSHRTRRRSKRTLIFNTGIKSPLSHAINGWPNVRDEGEDDALSQLEHEYDDNSPLHLDGPCVLRSPTFVVASISYLNIT